MTEEQINAIEARIESRGLKLAVNDEVIVDGDYIIQTGEEIPEKQGKITAINGVYVWVDGEQIHSSIVHRIEPTAEDDIRALLVELKETHTRLWKRAATAEGNAALFRQLLDEAVKIITAHVPGALLHIATIKYFLQRSKEALQVPSVGESQS